MSIVISIFADRDCWDDQLLYVLNPVPVEKTLMRQRII
jgi:hypothetical protein